MLNVECKICSAATLVSKCGLGLRLLKWSKVCQGRCWSDSTGSKICADVFVCSGPVIFRIPTLTLHAPLTSDLPCTNQKSETPISHTQRWAEWNLYHAWHNTPVYPLQNRSAVWMPAQVTMKLFQQSEDATSPDLSTSSLISCSGDWSNACKFELLTSFPYLLLRAL